MSYLFGVGVSLLGFAPLGACSLYFPSKPPPSGGVVVDAGSIAPPDSTPDAPPDAAPPADAGPPSTEAVSFGIDPAHDNLATATVASPLAPIWTAHFTGPVSYPLVVSGLVIVAVEETQPVVSALDIHTGAVVWGPNGFPSAVTVAYDQARVFVLDHDGNLTALDAFTGAQLWAIQITGASSPPVATGGLVYVNRLVLGGGTVAIDEATGATRWSASTLEGSDACVAVSGFTAYVAENCKQLDAWNAQSGASRWSHRGDCDGIGLTAPAVYAGKIWERDWPLSGVVIDGSGNMVDGFRADGLPAFHGGTAFYQANGTLSAVDIATDTVHWSFTGDGKLCTAPVVAAGSGQVFIGSRSGKVYELDEATGAPRSVHDVGTAVTCSSEHDGMALGEDHLVVPAGNEIVVY